MKRTLRDDQGISLLVVIMIMFLLLSMTGASLLFTGVTLKASSNLKTGTTALQAADAGIQHALTLISSGTTFSYSSSTTLVNSYAFSTGYTYTVTALNDSASTGGNTRAILTSTATGPNSTTRKIQAYVSRTSSGTWGPPGAFYFPGPSTGNINFQGTQTINGNDFNVDGSAGPNAAVPGITTNSAAAATQVESGIGTPSNVTGLGYSAGPPADPSVATTATPLNVNTLANSFTAQPKVSTCSGATLGTWTTPQITHCTGDMTLSGTVSGAGVLVVNGHLTVNNTFDFKGIIIVLGGEIRLQAGSTVNTYGTILTLGGPQVEDWGAGAIKYSSEAINKVNTTWPGVLSTPSPAKLVSWSEMMS